MSSTRIHPSSALLPRNTTRSTAPVRRTVSIVGGGLAGLMLGIGLRQRNVPVMLWEASGYPRHRVCGEFLSGRGLEVLESFGLLPASLESGARWATRAAFYSQSRLLCHFDLPKPALCVSRHELDALLARRFREMGGRLNEGQRYDGNIAAEGCVRATGRRLDGSPVSRRWFGVKAHMRNVTVTGDLDLHFHSDCYVGMCRLADGLVNVSGIFRHRLGKECKREPVTTWLHGEPGSPLGLHLASATIVPDSVCTVGGMDLTRRSAVGDLECRIGDALTMTPPLTGNGMSMALESASLAWEPLAAFSRSQIGWEEARQRLAVTLDQTFASRLHWASVFQRMLFLPAARAALMFAFSHSGWFRRVAFGHTR